MPKFRADYNVKSTLVLHGSNQELILSNDPLIIIKNDSADTTTGHVHGLDVQVVGDCESIDQAPNALRNLLAQKLDVLAFTTQSAFQIEQCYRVIEWEAHKKDRSMRALQRFDPLFPPEPNLIAEFTESAQRISDKVTDKHILRALRYFRYGLLGKQPEDQFQNFWLVLEVIGNGIKGDQPEPLICPECGANAQCAACSHVPQRTPIPKDAIKKLVEEVFPTDHQTAFKDLDKTRNGLLHGRLSESIEKELSIPFSDVVNAAGALAWHAIMRSLPEFDQPLDMGQRDGNYVSIDLIAGPTLSIEHTEASEHPSENKIPKVEIKMDVSYRPLAL